jgi:SAM-dependent methyltransferase
MASPHQAKSAPDPGLTTAAVHEPPRAITGWRKLSRGVLRPLMSWRARRIARNLGPLFTRGERVLDVGTGDGLVARAIAEVGHCSITGIDTVDYGDIGFPCLTYAGGRMPLGDDSFETVMALFSLHHSTDVETSLRECVRVAARRVILVEEVFKNRLEEIFTKGEDWVANRLLSGEVEVPFQFKSIAEWRGLFGRIGVDTELERRFFPLPFIPLRTMTFVLRKRSGERPSGQ